MFKKSFKGFMLAAAVSALMVPAAFAADDTNVTITGGTLAITEAPTVSDFAGVTLDGTAKSPTATLSAFEVNDARGTGSGWNVTVQATQFKEWASGDYVTDGKTLAASSMSMAAPSVSQDGTASAAPSMTGGPYTVDNSAQKIASAAAGAGAGMGKYDFTSSTLTLSIPPSAYAKAYRSDVTVTVSTGP